MSKKNILLASIIVLLVLSMIGCGPARNADETTEVFEFTPVAVKVDSVITEPVYNSIYTIGEVKAAEQFSVNAMTNGDVLEVYFKIGDFVKEGDILFTIETSDFEIDKSTTLTQSLNAVNQAKLSYDTSKENLSKYETLYKNGVASKAEYDNMVSAYNNARIAYNNALNSYESVKYNYESMGDNYQVTSPIDGIVTGKTVVEDMFVTSQNGFIIDTIDSYKVSATIASKYINEIEVGQAVEVYVSSIDSIIEGNISSISSSGSNGAYPIEISVEYNENIKTGMYVEAWVIVNESNEGQWISSKALIQENGQSFVYTIDDGKAKKVDVEIISLRGDLVAIKSELDASMQIITIGKEYVVNESPINIVE